MFRFVGRISVRTRIVRGCGTRARIEEPEACGAGDATAGGSREVGREGRDEFPLLGAGCVGTVEEMMFEGHCCAIVGVCALILGLSLATDVGSV